MLINSMATGILRACAWKASVIPHTVEIDLFNHVSIARVELEHRFTHALQFNLQSQFRRVAFGVDSGQAFRNWPGASHTLAAS